MQQREEEAQHHPGQMVFDVDERSYIAYARMALQGERPSGRDNAYEVRMMIPGDPKENRIGHMNFVDNRIDGATGTMRGRAIFDNPLRARRSHGSGPARSSS